MNEKGELITQNKLPSNEEIVDFLKSFRESIEVAIEATLGQHWLYDRLKNEGLKVQAFQSVEDQGHCPCNSDNWKGGLGYTSTSYEK